VNVKAFVSRDERGRRERETGEKGQGGRRRKRKKRERASERERRGEERGRRRASLPRLPRLSVIFSSSRSSTDLSPALTSSRSAGAIRSRGAARSPQAGLARKEEDDESEVARSSSPFLFLGERETTMTTKTQLDFASFFRFSTLSLAQQSLAPTLTCAATCDSRENLESRGTRLTLEIVSASVEKETLAFSAFARKVPKTEKKSDDEIARCPPSRLEKRQKESSLGLSPR